MADEAKLCREWIEIREETTADHFVFRSSTVQIPPTRGGRRGLELSESGLAEAKAPGPTDAMQSQGTGRWSLEGDMLHIELPGWAGDYEIEELKDNVLVLRKR